MLQVSGDTSKYECEISFGPKSIIKGYAGDDADREFYVAVRSALGFITAASYAAIVDVICIVRHPALYCIESSTESKHQYQSTHMSQNKRCTAYIHDTVL